MDTINYARIFSDFAHAAAADISDNLEYKPGAVGLFPFHRYEKSMIGRALTVRTRAGDNLFIHHALAMIQPGVVLVVDGGGDVSRALVGEIMTKIAQFRGAAGLVIDGAIRDVQIISAGAMPVFARAVNHRGPDKSGPGAINVPVCVGGMNVEPGDIVVGDRDGVVAFNPALADGLIKSVRAKEEREKQILASIADGSYTPT